MTRLGSGRHDRRSIRLRGYDYAQPGAYFVTICTRNRECVLGEIVDGRVALSLFGLVASECWQDLPCHFPDVTVDESVIMPNHVHGIIVIANAVGAADVGATHASPLPNASRPHGPKPRSLGAIIGSFKSATTRRVNRIRGTPGTPFWQRNYYEHVIRNEEDLEGVRTYVGENPLRWELDENHPNHLPPRDRDRTIELRD